MSRLSPGRHQGGWQQDQMDNNGRDGHHILVLKTAEKLF